MLCYRQEPVPVRWYHGTVVQSCRTLALGSMPGRRGISGSPETVCDDVVEVVEVVDSYASAESFCVWWRGTRKTQSGHDLKTPKEV